MVDVPLTTGEQIQLNRIITAAIPGPAFAPGVTRDGGMFKYRIKDWYQPVDRSEPEDDWSRRQVNIEPPSFINKTLWAQNVPAVYPFRKMEFDEGVTFVKKGTDSIVILGAQVDKTFVGVMVALLVIAVLISNRK